MKVKVCVSHEKNRDFLSAVVETLLLRRYSHIFFVHRDIMYHAIPGGIGTQDFKEYCKEHDIIGEKTVELYCPVSVFQAHMNFYKGIPYTYIQVLAFVPFIGKFFENKRKRAWCSEYVCWVLNDLGRRWDLAEGDLSTPKVFEKI